jgi:hypothetical protein
MWDDPVQVAMLLLRGSAPVASVAPLIAASESRAGGRRAATA